MIGVDLVHIPEFIKQKNLGGEAFLKRAFSESEISDDSSHLAGIWAAKEAVIKATGNITTTLNSIQIIYDKNGRPSAKLNQQTYDISISHHGDYAVAVAIGRGK